MNPRIPALLQPLLQDYISALQRQLPGFLLGLYVVGSIALDEFNEQLSDIDFVAVCQRQVTDADCTVLRAIHTRLATAYPRWPLSGSYLQIADLGRFEDAIPPHPYYHDGVLHAQGHFEINAVTWWVLAHHGIAVVGPEPGIFDLQVDWNDLITRMQENLNSYWASWIKRPDRLIALWFDRGIQWAVTGVLRQFYSFHENSITTKRRAAEYALTRLPTRWHRLIQEAINLRSGTQPSLYRWRLIRMLDAMSLISVLIPACNGYLAAQRLRTSSSPPDVHD